MPIGSFPPPAIRRPSGLKATLVLPAGRVQSSCPVASRQDREVGPARTHHCFFSTFVVKLEAMAPLIVSTIVMV
jgi:hypothetical protein